jgi:hypothetical protein
VGRREERLGWKPEAATRLARSRVECAASTDLLEQRHHRLPRVGHAALELSRLARIPALVELPALGVGRLLDALIIFLDLRRDVALGIGKARTDGLPAG